MYRGPVLVWLTAPQERQFYRTTLPLTLRFDRRYLREMSARSLKEIEAEKICRDAGNFVPCLERMERAEICHGSFS